MQATITNYNFRSIGNNLLVESVGNKMPIKSADKSKEAVRGDTLIFTGEFFEEIEYEYDKNTNE